MITSILAILLGLAVGAALAVLVGLPLRKRIRAQQAANPGAPRRSLIGTPAQRRRAMWVAAGLLAVVVVARAAGAGAWTAPIFLLSLLLAAQTAIFSLVDRLRAGRGRPGA